MYSPSPLRRHASSGRLLGSGGKARGEMKRKTCKRTYSDVLGFASRNNSNGSSSNNMNGNGSSSFDPDYDEYNKGGWEMFKKKPQDSSRSQRKLEPTNTNGAAGSAGPLGSPSAQSERTSNGATSSSISPSQASPLSSMDEWQNKGFPFYQTPDDSNKDEAAWDWGYIDHEYNPVWTSIRTQAEEQSRKEPLLSSYLYSSVLSHQTFEKALANVLANGIGDATLLSTQLYPAFLSILQKDKIRKAILLDIQVTKDRDPACTSYLEALLNYKGFHALQLHRIAHDLHTNGRQVMAQMLQSRSSEVYGVDIHPGAEFGKGILIDHGTGVVVGETAVVGDNTSLLQGVTLGGTGKATGDRHPKIGSNVLLGAGSTVLGNISVGEGSMIAAGSVVLKDVPDRTLIAGIPARIVGTTRGRPSTEMTQNFEQQDSFEDFEGIEYFL